MQKLFKNLFVVVVVIIIIIIIIIIIMIMIMIIIMIIIIIMMMMKFVTIDDYWRKALKLDCLFKFITFLFVDILS